MSMSDEDEGDDTEDVGSDDDKEEEEKEDDNGDVIEDEYEDDDEIDEIHGGDGCALGVDRSARCNGACNACGTCNAAVSWIFQ